MFIIKFKFMLKIFSKFFKRVKNVSIRNFNPLYVAGDKVTLINDPKQQTYIVEKLVCDKNGLPEISRGPMRQLPASFVYRVVNEKWGGISDFRSDSLQLKSQTAVERKISDLKQSIKVKEERYYDLLDKAQKIKNRLEILKTELKQWETQPEHVV